MSVRKGKGRRQRKAANTRCEERDEGKETVHMRGTHDCRGCQDRIRRHREVVPSHQLGASPNLQRNNQRSNPERKVT